MYESTFKQKNLLYYMLYMQPISYLSHPCFWIVMRRNRFVSLRTRYLSRTHPQVEPDQYLFLISLTLTSGLSRRFLSQISISLVSLSSLLLVC